MGCCMFFPAFVKRAIAENDALQSLQWRHFIGCGAAPRGAGVLVGVLPAALGSFLHGRYVAP